MKEDNLQEKLIKYRDLTTKALEKVKLNKRNSQIDNENGKKLLETAKSYYSDAQYFEKSQMPLTALAAYSYSHAWIDAGVKLGLLDGKGDDKLFVLP